MKRQIILASKLVIAVLFLLAVNSCTKDSCSHTYRLYQPVYQSLTNVWANMKSNGPQELRSPGKLYLYGNYIFLNELNKGIHVIDNSQPSNPKNVAFITIPGNMDLVVKGNTLYADSYVDLVTLDISNPRQVVLKKVVPGVFPHRAGYYMRNASLSNPDSVMVVVDWIEKDTTVSCQTYYYLQETYYSLANADNKGYYASSQIGSPGMGGSMAQFALMNDYLYTVTSSSLNTFDLATPQEPSLKSVTNIGANIETIYPFKDKLFIGSQNGMFIYDVSSAGNPVKQGTFSHVRSCDPVIADGDNAYVTLRSGTQCNGYTNQLDVLAIGNMYAPSLLKSYSMTNPHGLSKDGNVLFICDGQDGLKIYDASNPKDIKLTKQVGGMNTFDVIAWNKKAIVVAQEGLFQFDYSNTSDVRLLSKISLSK